MQTSAHPIDARGGFTLAEVLMAILVLGMVSALLARVLQGSLRIQDIQQHEPGVIREREADLARQFAGESGEPVLTFKPRETAP